MFSLLREGAKWGVPRSGLIFEKRGGKLFLVDIMPWEPGMPIAPNVLLSQQAADIDIITATFKAAGITVEKDLP